MNFTLLGRTAAGIAVTGLVLAACSGSGTANTGTGIQVQPTVAPQTYVAPSDTPVAVAVTPAPTPAVMDSTTNKPALSTKDDAASLNTDLNNTAVTQESFN